MKPSPFGLAAALALVATQLCGAPAKAQLLDTLKNAVGSGQGSSSLGGSALGGLGGLGGSGGPAIGSASTGNIAGVLQYCVQNNYLGGGSAGSVKDALVSKVTGSGQGQQSQRQQSSSGFAAGSHGILEGAGGQNVTLGGGGLKQQVTTRVCSEVLKRAKSLL